MIVVLLQVDPALRVGRAKMNNPHSARDGVFRNARCASTFEHTWGIEPRSVPKCSLAKAGS